MRVSEIRLNFFCVFLEFDAKLRPDFADQNERKQI